MGWDSLTLVRGFEKELKNVARLESSSPNEPPVHPSHWSEWNRYEKMHLNKWVIAAGLLVRSVARRVFLRTLENVEGVVVAEAEAAVDVDDDMLGMSCLVQRSVLGVKEGCGSDMVAAFAALKDKDLVACTDSDDSTRRHYTFAESRKKHLGSRKKPSLGGGHRQLPSGGVFAEAARGRLRTGREERPSIP